MAPPQGYVANALMGKIYSPSGAVLYDATTDGALTNASMATAYPFVAGTDTTHDTAAGVGAVGNAGGVATMLAGTLASRPAAGTAGRFYFATDSQAWSYDTGSAWQNVTIVAVAGTIGGSATWSGAQTFGADIVAAAGVTNWHLVPSSGGVVGMTNNARSQYGLYVTDAASPTTHTMNNTLDDGSGNASVYVLAVRVATGTAPFAVASTTLNPNLNAERWGGAKNDVVLVKFAGASYSTTGTGMVSTGEGGSFAPTSTKVQVLSSVDCYNQTAGDGVMVAIYRNTSGVPAAGTAVGTDTPVAVATMTSATASADATVALVGLDSGLTAGTTYYYYWAVAAYIAGTGAIANASLSGGPQTTSMLLRST